MTLTLRGIALALGGHIERLNVRAPGPGHNRHDRSLLVGLSPTAVSGFIVHSFAGDDWRTCHTYVRQKLGLPPLSPREKRGFRAEHAVDAVVIDPEQERYAKARELWAGARTDELRQQLRLTYPKLFKDAAAWDEAFRLAGQDRTVDPVAGWERRIPPPEYSSWPLERRNQWMAAAAADYRDQVSGR